MLVFSNVGFMGYPVAEALFGPDSAFHVTIFVLVFQFVSYSVGVNLISDGASPFRFDVRILLRPLVITALLASLFFEKIFLLHTPGEAPEEGPEE